MAKKSKAVIKMAQTNNSEFHKACLDAKIPATKRQWGKWRRGLGLAYNTLMREIHSTPE